MLMDYCLDSVLYFISNKVIHVKYGWGIIGKILSEFSYPTNKYGNNMFYNTLYSSGNMCIS